MRDHGSIVQAAINLEQEGQEIDLLLGKVGDAEALVGVADRAIKVWRLDIGARLAKVRASLPAKGPGSKKWGDFVAARGISQDSALNWIKAAEMAERYPAQTASMSLTEMYRLEKGKEPPSIPNNSGYPPPPQREALGPSAAPPAYRSTKALPVQEKNEDHPERGTPEWREYMRRLARARLSLAEVTARAQRFAGDYVAMEAEMEEARALVAEEEDQAKGKGKGRPYEPLLGGAEGEALRGKPIKTGGGHVPRTRREEAANRAERQHSTPVRVPEGGRLVNPPGADARAADSDPDLRVPAVQRGVALGGDRGATLEADVQDPRTLEERPLYTSNSDCWLTPVVVRDLLLEFAGPGGIALDPCSHPLSIIPATTKWLGPDHGGRDALIQDWVSASKGGLIFVNPPYGRVLASWADKIATEVSRMPADHAGLVLLVPARVDTMWWSTLPIQSWIAWKGRLTFLEPIEDWRGRRKGKDSVPTPPEVFPGLVETDPSTFPSALLYFGPRGRGFADVFGRFGRLYTAAQEVFYADHLLPNLSGTPTRQALNEATHVVPPTDVLREEVQAGGSSVSAPPSKDLLLVASHLELRLGLLLPEPVNIDLVKNLISDLEEHSARQARQEIALFLDSLQPTEAGKEREPPGAEKLKEEILAWGRYRGSQESALKESQMVSWISHALGIGPMPLTKARETIEASIAELRTRPAAPPAAPQDPRSTLRPGDCIRVVSGPHAGRRGILVAQEREPSSWIVRLDVKGLTKTSIETLPAQQMEVNQTLPRREGLKLLAIDPLCKQWRKSLQRDLEQEK